MAYTQAQLDSLERAIAEGALVVKYEDRTITYRELGAMTRLAAEIRKQLGLVSNRANRTRIATNKDLGDPWGSSSPYVTTPPWLPL